MTTIFINNKTLLKQNKQKFKNGIFYYSTKRSVFSVSGIKIYNPLSCTLTCFLVHKRFTHVPRIPNPASRKPPLHPNIASNSQSNSFNQNSQQAAATTQESVNTAIIVPKRSFTSPQKIDKQQEFAAQRSIDQALKRQPHNTPNAIKNTDLLHPFSGSIKPGLGVALQANQHAANSHRASAQSTISSSSSDTTRALVPYVERQYLPVPYNVNEFPKASSSVAPVVQSAPQDSCEHVLATSAGLLPIISSFAENPQAVQTTFKFFDSITMSLRHKPETLDLLKTLLEHGLVNLHGANGREGCRPTKPFWTIWNKFFKNKIKTKDISLNLIDLKDSLPTFQAEICLLNISEENILVTEFLLPEQTHIALYTTVGDIKIAWSYFTTDKGETNIFLSKTQPFGDDPEKINRPQMLHITPPTFINDNHLTPLYFKTIEEANIYLSLPEIQEQLKQIFIEKILPQLKESKSIVEYNSIGVTNNQIEVVINDFNKEQEILAKNRFKRKYIDNLKYDQQHLNTTKVDDWLQKIKEKAPHEYPHIIKLVNQYNEANNISIRY